MKSWLAFLALLLWQPAPAEDFVTVLMATRRAGRVEFFDPKTLRTLGSIAVDVLAETVSASPDGRTLFIAQALPPDRRIRRGCCALFALDLETQRMCHVLEPAMLGTLSPNGELLFINRGACGIDLVDARTLSRRVNMAGPGNYSLHVSPDAEWLFGVTWWKGPSLDIFDLRQERLVRRLPVPDQLLPQGAWMEDRFYLYAFDGGRGRLWTVTSETDELGRGLSVELPELVSDCHEPVFQTPVAGGERLFLFERFGMKLDRRRDCRGPVPGGIYVLNPSNGEVLARLAPSLYFAHLVAKPDGTELYGIALGARDWITPVLLRLDAQNGKVLTERRLETDVWFLTLATLPNRLLPRAEVRPIPCNAP